MTHYAIICAFPPEISPFTKALEIHDKHSFAGIRWWKGRYGDKTVTLVMSGMGKVHAAAAAQTLILQEQPEAVFSCGTAGSLDAHCHIGDVVLSTTAIQHDYGFVTPDAHIHFGIYLHTGKKRRYMTTFPADPHLLNIAAGLDFDNSRQFRIISGPLVSGDQVIVSSQKRQELHEQFRAYAVDMESAAIAQVCAMHHIPFLAIRGISDYADETLSVDTTHIDPHILADLSSPSFRQKASALAQLMTYFAQHPSAFVLSLQTRQNIHRAAQHSAEVTLHLLQTLQETSVDFSYRSIS